MLDRKKGAKHEIHIVDSPFNEGPKNFFQGGPNFGRGTAGKFREMDNKSDIYSSASLRGGQFRKRLSAPTPWYQNLCDASIFYQILGKKILKAQFSGLNLTFL